MKEASYIPHIKNSLPKDVFTFQLSFYPVALEGWRRGLKLKYQSRKRGGGAPMSVTYTLADEKNEYQFYCARGSKTEQEGITITDHKDETYKYFKKNNVPVPESRTFEFNETSIEDMCKYGESIGYPLVAKATNLGGGNGVFTHINTKEDLESALLKIKNRFNRDNVLIEKYFENSVDYRFYVIEDEVIAVSKSYSSNVIGDGRSNVEQLIKKRNVEIKNNVVHQKKMIVKDKELIDYLEERGLSLDYVPKERERLFLRKHGTYLKDRLNVACTSTVDPKFKKYAVDALKSIPGLPTGSVDMIINEEKNEGIVNEINTKGEIAMHIFPLEGEAVDIPKYLIDYYFPGSKKVNNNFYFEYKPVKELFLEGTADEITIPMYPEGQYYKKEFNVTGKNFGTVYLKGLKRRAAKLHLKGHIKAISTNKLEIMLIGRKEEIDKFGKFIKRLAKNKTQIDQINRTETVEFDGVNTIALEVLNDDVQSPKTSDETESNIEERIDKIKKQYLEEKKILLKEKDEWEQRYKALEEKKSGQTIESVRRIGSMVKKKLNKK